MRFARVHCAKKRASPTVVRLSPVYENLLTGLEPVAGDPGSYHEIAFPPLTFFLLMTNPRRVCSASLIFTNHPAFGKMTCAWILGLFIMLLCKLQPKHDTANY